MTGGNFTCGKKRYLPPFYKRNRLKNMLLVVLGLLPWFFLFICLFFLYINYAFSVRKNDRISLKQRFMAIYSPSTILGKWDWYLNENGNRQRVTVTNKLHSQVERSHEAEGIKMYRQKVVRPMFAQVEKNNRESCG